MSLPALLEQRLRLPVVAAPMFLISNPQLVLACCRNGVVGSFPALNQRDSSGFKAWLEEIEAGLATLDNPAPYAVNLIVHNSNPRLQADLAICIEHKVPVVITSLGAVKEVVDAVHSYGGLVFHDVTTRRHAEKAAEAGVDGLIALNPGIFQSGGWIHAKLTLVVLLIGYHHMCGAQVKRFARGKNTRSHVFYRWFNEVPVLILLAIVILVVVKPF